MQDIMLLSNGLKGECLSRRDRLPGVSHGLFEELLRMFEGRSWLEWILSSVVVTDGIESGIFIFL